MGRPGFSLITRIVCLAASGLLAGCGASPQTASNPHYAAPVAQPLIGATPTSLSAEFGQPALLRVDGAAQVWLYHSSSCGLNLVLYPDASGTPRVAMVSTADSSLAPADCTLSLRQAHFDTASPPSISTALEPPAPS